MNKLVTIAIHTGKREYYYLLENLLKSFLVCNEYPNIELLLIESGGNNDIRKWLSLLNFDKEFVNFNGDITDIKKNKGVRIVKTLLFKDFDSKAHWSYCYMNSMMESIKVAKGEYFVFLAEDNQFTLKGDVISDYILALDNYGSNKTILEFCSLQQYKHLKKNNLFEGPYLLNNKVIVYKPFIMKWSPFSFCKKTIYDDVGEMVNSTIENQHSTIDDYSEKCKNLNFERLYPAAPIGMWFNNSNRDYIIKTIREQTKNNPNFILYRLHKRDSVYEHVKKLTCPLSTENYMI